MIHEIRKPFPVKITSKDNAEATAMFLLDYSQEHDTLFGVFMRTDNSFWWIPQSEVRLFDNWSLGRPVEKVPCVHQWTEVIEHNIIAPPKFVCKKCGKQED